MNENIKQLYEDKEKTIEAFPRVWMPIGSLYWNENDISSDIDKYFIGSWQRVTDKFIVAAGIEFPIGTTGGSKNHFHEIRLSLPMDYGDILGENFNTQEYGLWSFQENKYSKTSSQGISTFLWNGGHTLSSSTPPNEGKVRTSVSNGDTSSSSSLPPYQAFYCWKRVS